MSDFFRELIGVKCDFETEDASYKDYVVKDISGEWIYIENKEQALYLNLSHVISAKVSKGEEFSRGIFRRKED